MSYYEKWFRGLSELLVAHGFVTAAEMASGHAAPVGDRKFAVAKGGGTICHGRDIALAMSPAAFSGRKRK